MIRSAHQTTQPTPWRKEVRKALLCYMEEHNISFDIVSYPTTFGAFLQPISYCALLSNILKSLKDHKKFYLKPKIRSPSILEIILINSIPLVCLHNQLCLISYKARTCSVSVRHVPVPQIFTYDYSQNGRAPNFGF